MQQTCFTVWNFLEIFFVCFPSAVGRIYGCKSRLIGKEQDAEKVWGQEEKEATEDEMVGWHHQLNRHEFEQTLGDADGQGSLACYSLWGHKKSDMTEWLNNKMDIESSDTDSQVCTLC